MAGCSGSLTSATAARGGTFTWLDNSASTDVACGGEREAGLGGADRCSESASGFSTGESAGVEGPWDESFATSAFSGSGPLFAGGLSTWLSAAPGESRRATTMLLRPVVGDSSMAAGGCRGPAATSGSRVAEFTVTSVATDLGRDRTDISTGPVSRLLDASAVSVGCDLESSGVAPAVVCSAFPVVAGNAVTS